MTRPASLRGPRPLLKPSCGKASWSSCPAVQSRTHKKNTCKANGGVSKNGGGGGSFPDCLWEIILRNGFNLDFDWPKGWKLASRKDDEQNHTQLSGHMVWSPDELADELGTFVESKSRVCSAVRLQLLHLASFFAGSCGKLFPSVLRAKGGNRARLRRDSGGTLHQLCAVYRENWLKPKRNQLHLQGPSRCCKHSSAYGECRESQARIRG